MAKSINDFENKHGQPKIAKLNKELAAEQEKVAALSGVQNKVNIERRDDCKFAFALIGDLHIGSLYAHSGAYTGFLEHLEELGVEDCYITGDVLEGHRVYRGQEFEVGDVGLDAQLERLHKTKTPPSIRVSFITGNHDSSFKNLAGVSVGKSIASAKPGWRFLGEDQARVQFRTPNGKYDLMLLHPGGGTSYALSYRPQKIAESIEGGLKPNMIGIGHYHKAEFIPSYRNIALCQTGTFCKQTPFMARQGLAAHVGGWIMTVNVGKMYNCVQAEFISFY